jgi:CRISPR-associated endonuclease/helicase Cas3
VGFLAHSAPGHPEHAWHRLADHLIGTGDQAAQRAAAFGAERLARLAGRLHDLGKYSERFQKRVRGSAVRVDHATHGAVHCKNLRPQSRDELFATSLAAFAIAGHHAGLPDWKDLSDRMGGPLEPLWADWQSELSLDTTALFPATFQVAPDRDTCAYQLGFLGRMVFSCLVDGDWRDTEHFYDSTEGLERPREWPTLTDRIEQACSAFDGFMADLETKPSGAPEVTALRRQVRDHALARAADPAGLFTLTVPTGGGKTLTSLGFALHHARAHRKRRIIYVIPYTSIIDQTAAQIREVLGDDLVLEHHSSTDFDKPDAEDRARDKGTAWKLALAMEDWAAPVIVTTSVQFFESLHSNRPSKCRKLHTLADAVIVIDEAQTLPRGLLRPCIEAIRELARNYGASIVLCTATQPALGKTSFKHGLDLDGRELAPDPEQLSRRLRRVTLKATQSLSDADLVNQLRATPQGLIIVNSRAHALLLYDEASRAGLEGLVHLTTRQRPIDRRAILANVRSQLKHEQPCRLIATSLVEAGVDIDFPQVWRAVTGLDQIAQAAGRCNREGKRCAGDSFVTVFRPADHKTPPDLDALAHAFQRVFERFPADPFAPEAIRAYFEEVYWRDGNDLDAFGFFRGSSRMFVLNGNELAFKYRTCAESFRMIDDTQVPVFVVLNEDTAAHEVLEQLKDPKIRPGGLLRQLSPYSVPVFPAARQKLIASGNAQYLAHDRFGDRFCRLIGSTSYSNESGLRWETADELRTSDSIF